MAVITLETQCPGYHIIETDTMSGKNYSIRDPYGSDEYFGNERPTEDQVREMKDRLEDLFGLTTPEQEERNWVQGHYKDHHGRMMR